MYRLSVFLCCCEKLHRIMITQVTCVHGMLNPLLEKEKETFQTATHPLPPGSS